MAKQIVARINRIILLPLFLRVPRSARIMTFPSRRGNVALTRKTGKTLLKNGHVVDPAQGIDRIADVLIEDGRIVSVGGPPPHDAAVVDVAGCYVSPGWIDIHVHAYG